MKQLLANPLSILLYISIAESFTLRPSPRRNNAVELTLLEKRFLSPARPRSLSFIGPLSSIVGAEPPSSSDQIEIDSTQLIQSLLELTRHETDGTKLLFDERESINDIVKSLEALSIENTFTDTNGVDYTSIPLEGEHKLIYIDSERTPQYIGPFKGSTTQYFGDETMFENRLTFGPIQIALTADRKRMDESRMKIKFQSFGVKVFGSELVKKELKQQGVWKMVFVGMVKDNLRTDDIGGAKNILLRVMRTPSLYILAKEL
eukprot:scaffold2640_cov256-Chaetoceros_neogracile.AAC.2